VSFKGQKLNQKMLYAYSEVYLKRAQAALGEMLKFAVYDLHFCLSDFWDIFLGSNTCLRFERGDCKLLARKSGVEITYEMLGNGVREVTPQNDTKDCVEYWAGWALAYFQWKTALSFKTITNAVTIEEICLLYYVYHTMDVRYFCARMRKLVDLNRPQTNLRQIRKNAGISQSELSRLSGVPVSDIQHFEMRIKDINSADKECLFALSKVLCCRTIDLLDYDNVCNILDAFPHHSKWF
jgi:hypothetical protein